MNYKLITKLLGAVLVSLGITATFVIASQSAPSRENGSPAAAIAAAQHGGSDEQGFAERDELRRNFQLSPGARVEVSSIRGPVDIETSDTNSAEVYVLRTARSREDLNFHKISVEGTTSSLAVRGVGEGEEQSNARVRHRVVLKVPRQVELLVSSINGRVRIGEIDGSLKLRSINGGAQVARATRHAEISSINGGVTVTLARLDEQGVRVRSINGGIDLRFADELNADVEVSHYNGGVHADLLNVTMQSRSDKSHFRARIGSGGIPITISNVNGGVRLTRD